MSDVEKKHTALCTIMGQPDGSIRCIGWHCPKCGASEPGQVGVYPVRRVEGEE